MSLYITNLGVGYMGFFDELKKNEDTEHKIQAQVNELKAKANALKAVLDDLYKQYRESGLLVNKKNELFQKAIQDFISYFSTRDFSIKEDKQIKFSEITATYHELTVTLITRPDEHIFDLKVPKGQRSYTVIIKETEKEDNQLQYIEEISEKDNADSLTKKIQRFENNISVMKETLSKIDEVRIVFTIYDSSEEFSNMIEVLNSIE